MKVKSNLFYGAAINVMFLLNGCDIVTCVEPEIPVKNYPQFQGEWQWIKTHNGWGGIETPATKGYSETIIFGTDNRYKKLRNGSVTEETAYQIIKQKSANSGQDSVFVYYKSNASTGQPLYLIGSDTLHTRISEVCFDCPEEYFVRKKNGTN